MGLAPLGGLVDTFHMLHDKIIGLSPNSMAKLEKQDFRKICIVRSICWRSVASSSSLQAPDPAHGTADDVSCTPLTSLPSFALFGVQKSMHVSGHKATLCGTLMR